MGIPRVKVIRVVKVESSVSFGINVLEKITISGVSAPHEHRVFAELGGYILIVNERRDSLDSLDSDRRDGDRNGSRSTAWS